MEDKDKEILKRFEKNHLMVAKQNEEGPRVQNELMKRISDEIKKRTH